MNEYRLGFRESEVLALFNAFDVNKNGSIDYDEFLRTIRVRWPLTP